MYSWAGGRVGGDGAFVDGIDVQGCLETSVDTYRCSEIFIDTRYHFCFGLGVGLLDGIVPRLSKHGTECGIMRY